MIYTIVVKSNEFDQKSSHTKKKESSPQWCHLWPHMFATMVDSILTLAKEQLIILIYKVGNRFSDFVIVAKMC